MSALKDLILAAHEAGVRDIAIHLGDVVNENGGIEVLVKSGTEYADVDMCDNGTLVTHSTFPFYKVVPVEAAPEAGVPLDEAPVDPQPDAPQPEEKPATEGETV